MDSTVKIWARLGVELEVSEEQALKILQGDEKALLKTLTAPNTENGFWRIDGDTYIPQAIMEDFNGKYPNIDCSGDVGFDLPTTAVTKPQETAVDDVEIPQFSDSKAVSEIGVDYRYEICDKDGDIIDTDYASLESAIEYAVENGGMTINKLYYPLNEDGEIDYSAEITAAEVAWEKPAYKDLETRNFTTQERMNEICNNALDYLGELINRNEIYSVLTYSLGMTDEEITKAGFDCVPETGEIEQEYEEYDDKVNSAIEELSHRLYDSFELSLPKLAEEMSGSLVYDNENNMLRVNRKSIVEEIQLEFENKEPPVVTQAYNFIVDAENRKIDLKSYAIGDVPMMNTESITKKELQNVLKSMHTAMTEFRLDDSYRLTQIDGVNIGRGDKDKQKPMSQKPLTQRLGEKREEAAARNTNKNIPEKPGKTKPQGLE